ncbi:DUF3574 domain-containing protein [Rhodoligotrophos ferricapiens]|uniref:DUF3574 domain-containing protein n=1 Tax=Rhodoligotrophos ferricapiens TaxID=3069264 RepID=UPI00315C559E
MPLRSLLTLIAVLFNLAAIPAHAQERKWHNAEAIQSQLYFGLRSKDGAGVSEQAWARFLSEVVTPRFPDGLTVLSAYGQSRDQASAPALTTAETTKLLLIVHPDTHDAQKKLGEIKAEYVKRFKQDSVFQVEVPARIVE